MNLNSYRRRQNDEFTLQVRQQRNESNSARVDSDLRLSLWHPLVTLVLNGEQASCKCTEFLLRLILELNFSL